MDRPTTPPLPPWRIVALVLITVLIAGLLDIRLGAGDDLLSVPADAQAGDLTLESCSYDTEDGSLDAECGTLVVAETQADPQSRLIALPVIRIRARSDHPGAPIFRLEGGPGVTNMEFEQASRFTDDHDLVMVGYRGVDGSVRLDCPEVSSALKRSTDLLGEQSISTVTRAYRACADRLTDEGIDLAQYGLVQQVADMESVRTALEYDRIDLLSESAGTRTAMIYAWRHPGSIHRSVMVAVNPPGHFLWDPEATDEQIERYAALCATDNGCSRRTDDLAATIREAAAEIPDRWLFLPIEDANILIASMRGLFESSSSNYPASAPAVIDTWLSATEGDAAGLWFASIFGDVFLPDMFVWGQLAAGARADAAAAREYFASTEPDYSNLGYADTASLWAKGGLVDSWPAVAEEDEYRQVRASDVATLLVSGELDVSTPPQAAATDLLPFLPNGHQVVLPGFGHTASLWADQPEAGTRLITTFFDSGQVDDSGYEPQPIDFTPPIAHGTLAKIAVGSMLALAALTIGSLIWMARRTRRRGFGRGVSVALRSVYPVVLGLGGWSLATLAILTARVTVPLDHGLLAVPTVGVPIGLGVYLAWADPQRSVLTRRQALAVAPAGALAGAWLGFSPATVGFAELGFAVVGAIVGANLAVILLDISTTRTRPTSPVRAELAREHVGT